MSSCASCGLPERDPGLPPRRRRSAVAFRQLRQQINQGRQERKRPRPLLRTPLPRPTPESSPPAASAPPAGGESAPISGPSAEEQQARQVVETAPTLSSVG